MDKRSRLILNSIIYFSLVLTLGMTVATNAGNLLRLLPLSVLIILSFSLRRAFLKRSGYFLALAYATFIVDIILVYFISMQDMSRVSQIYFFVLIIDAVFCYSLRFSLFSAFVIYLTYIFVRFIRYIKWNTFDFDYFSPALYENALYFIFVYLIIYIAKRQFIQSQILSNTMSELEVKTKQLGETNIKLQDTLGKLEKMTAIKERNRIAREIHDTVGHTLTTVLIEIEAGKRLMGKNRELAAEKLDLAQEQVRKGLNDIRQSVRALKEGNDVMSLIPSLQSLIRETERHADVAISFDFDSELSISEVQGKVLYSALQEGLTNGIRHGGSKQFSLRLSQLNGNILFSLKDNGSGCQEIFYGFGLTAMKERVQGLGGLMEIATRPGQGFCLNIRIPLSEEAFNEKDQHSDCG